MTAGGTAVTPGPGAADEPPESEGLRAARLDLKLCRALAAMNPPEELAGPLHSRIAAQVRKLGRYRATDLDARQAADLSDDELREAMGIIRAIRALPTWPEMRYQGSGNLRASLGGYALDVAGELDRRGRDNP